MNRNDSVGEKMDTDRLNPIDASADAVLELEEMRQGLRDDAPALAALIRIISSPPIADDGGIRMLDDFRSYALFRDSIAQKRSVVSLKEFGSLIEKYLNDLEEGVTSKNHDKLKEAKRFCIAFNEGLLSRRMAEIYHKRESMESRYSHESLS